MFFDDEDLIVCEKNKGVDVKTLITPKREFNNIPNFTDNELRSNIHQTLVYDVECYYNFCCITFINLDKTKKVTLRQSPDENIDIEKLRFLMFMYQTTGFNNHFYDVVIVSAILAGITSTVTLKAITVDLIEFGLPIREIENKYEFKVLSLTQINSVDLIEVCPLQFSLKGYSARLHAKRLQDLPFDPDAILTQSEALIIEDYNVTDCCNTVDLTFELREQLSLRVELSNKYQVDLRSKSDAQIAEAVIGAEIAKLSGKYPAKPKLKDGYFCQYKKPDFITFKTDYLNQLLETILSLKFNLDKNGSPLMPYFKNGTFSIVSEQDEADSESKNKIKLKINNTTYTVGIGGLHSCEKETAHKAGNGYSLYDNDVESFYPRIILICKLFPKHIGEAFLKVYQTLVEMRVTAKGLSKSKDLSEAEHNQIIADSLKIVINGSFGKLGSKYSILYSPDLMLQVTITGQLSLLMLIESLELAGIEVVSANTDGIVVKCHESKREEMLAIIEHWRQVTGFKTEETEYTMLLSRDVNNYIAVKPDGKVKLKGAYSNPWADKKQAIFRFHKNPMTTICIEAVCDFITKQRPILETIKSCKDITKFVCVKRVKGGGFKGNTYLGKIVRWYYASGIKDAIYYIGSGNKVGETEGAKPLMDLPDDLPTDIDYAFYAQKCYSILTKIGYYKKESLL